MKFGEQLYWGFSKNTEPKIEANLDFIVIAFYGQQHLLFTWLTNFGCTLY